MNRTKHRRREKGETCTVSFITPTRLIRQSSAVQSRSTMNIYSRSGPLAEGLTAYIEFTDEHTLVLIDWHKANHAGERSQKKSKEEDMGKTTQKTQHLFKNKGQT